MQKIKNQKYLIALFAIFIIYGCTTQVPNRAIATVSESIESPDAIEITPSATSGTLIGTVTNKITNEPLQNTIIRLAIIFWNDDQTDGAFVLEGARSPSTISDEKGKFVFVELEEADYVIVVGDVLGYHEILSNPDGSAIVYKVEKGTITNIGRIQVDIAN